MADYQNLILDLRSDKKKLTDEKERNTKLFASKIDALTFEKDKALETKKSATDELFKA